MKVQDRQDLLICGNPGDVRRVRAGVSWLRINYGPGYRVSYQQRRLVLIIVLAAGDKRAPRKIGPGVALGPIHSSCCSGSRWSARAELEFFEVPKSTQTKDIESALELARNFNEDE